jgi:hypothetical protein
MWSRSPTAGPGQCALASVGKAQADLSNAEGFRRWSIQICQGLDVGFVLVCTLRTRQDEPRPSPTHESKQDGIAEPHCGISIPRQSREARTEGSCEKRSKSESSAASPPAVFRSRFLAVLPPSPSLGPTASAVCFLHKSGEPRVSELQHEADAHRRSLPEICAEAVVVAAARRSDGGGSGVCSVAGGGGGVLRPATVLWRGLRGTVARDFVLCIVLHCIGSLRRRAPECGGRGTRRIAQRGSMRIRHTHADQGIARCDGLGTGKRGVSEGPRE